jgi:hypothetical protein
MVLGHATNTNARTLSTSALFHLLNSYSFRKTASSMGPEALSQEVNWPRREADHTPPPTGEAELQWSYTSPFVSLHGLHRDNLIFTLYEQCHLLRMTHNSNSAVTSNMCPEVTTRTTKCILYRRTGKCRASGIIGRNAATMSSAQSSNTSTLSFLLVSSRHYSLIQARRRAAARTVTWWELNQTPSVTNRYAFSCSFDNWK